MPQLPEPINHTVAAIYAAIEARAYMGDSRGVPMSDAVNPCDRATWYRLRWAAPTERVDGQKESKFETGRRWETRLLDDLEAAGVVVERIDPATGKQFTAELANGWLRGKLDGRGLNIPEAPKTVHVIEAKSHSEKSFKELVKHNPLTGGEGLKKSKLEHYAQCQSYMHCQGVTRCLYIAVNKNTDERYAERVEYDATFVITMEARITRLASTDVAPPRLFDDPKSKGAFACAWCTAFAQCHEQAFARVNCRTCLHASLEDGANVRCTKSGELREYKQQQSGCSDHRYLPSIVPGEQIDVQGDLIVYRLKDGSLWRDGNGDSKAA
jgi:hypothetical protein